MLYTSWSIALLICCCAVLFLAVVAARTAVRVLRFWDNTADTARQIGLERETWLVSLVMQNGLVLQLVSLVLLVLAAENFAGVIAGAMCATGTFWANEYGPILLLVRITLVFLSGFWLLINYLDNSSEYRPLLKAKFIYLLFLFPLVAADSSLSVFFLSNLQPDIITSCCGVIFSDRAADGGFVSKIIAPETTGITFYILYGVIVCSGVLAIKKRNSPSFWEPLYSLLSAIFFGASLWAVIQFFSPYIYANPSHRCPFDFLQVNYGYVGYPIYFLLFTSSFAGMSIWLAASLGLRGRGVGPAGQAYKNRAIVYSLVAYTLFVVIISWFPAQYMLAGGEG